MKQLIIIFSLCLLPFLGFTQKIQNSSRSTNGYIKTDGTIQNSNRRTCGYIKDNGTIQNANRRTIGYANNIQKEWAAVTFFFFEFE